MSTFFCFENITDARFLLLNTLVITLSNYNNNKICQQVFTNDSDIFLLQSIDKVIKINKEIQDYIMSFSDNFYIHIDAKFYNKNNEYISGEFYSKNVAELKKYCSFYKI